MGKKILLINGSPRKNGLTFTMLNHIKQAIDKLNETANLDKRVDVEILQLGEYKLNHCTACDACLRKPNKCSIADQDDHAKLEAALIGAKGIIIGSPTYFGSVTGLVKDLIDRSRPWKMAGYLLKNKLFSPIVTAGLQNGGANFTQDVLIHFALIQGMQVVGALGHPVLEPNLPAETLQMQGLKEFRKNTEIGEIAQKACQNLAQRFFELL
jgi:multimeric flavodoxin WrbA